LLDTRVHAADISETDGAKLLFEVAGERHTHLKKVWCDGGYGKPAGSFATWMQEQSTIAVEIVQKLVDQVGFVVLPRRWVVERTISWLCRCRRLSKDYERRVFCSESHIYIASIGLLLGELTRA
jgi:putative transposase